MNSEYTALTNKLHADCENLVKGIELFSATSRHAQRYNGMEVHTHLPCKLYKYAEQGIPLLCVPSLINRAYILDLDAEKSLMLSLTKNGFSPYLIDWGDVDATSSTLHYNLGDYIAKILLPIIQQISQTHQRPLVLIGYCLGGIMAAIAAASAGDKLVCQLSLLATPWDFNTAPFAQLKNIEMPAWQQITERMPYIEADFLQLLFYWNNIFAVHRKYEKLGRGELDLASFLPLEHWANDGVNMSKAAFNECIVGFIHNNKLANNNYYLAGKHVDLHNMPMRTLCVMADKDKIVPHDSSIAAFNFIHHVELYTVQGGHLAIALEHRDAFSARLREFIA